MSYYSDWAEDCQWCDELYERIAKLEAALDAKTRELEQARLLIEGLHKAYKKEIKELCQELYNKEV